MRMFVLLLSTTLAILGCGDQGDKSVTAPSAHVFPDANLEAAVRQALGNSDMTLRDADLRSLSQLEASSLKIIDLAEIQRLSNLQTLDLSSNQIHDIAPLAGLTKLRSLNLQNNQVGDLTPLAGLSQLQIAVLDSNAVKDISMLLDLAALKEVHLAGNPLAADAVAKHIPALQARGVMVDFDPMASGTQVPFRIAYAVGQDILLADPARLRPDTLANFNSRGLYFLRWSPDGQRLVFATDSDLYVVDTSGGDPVKLNKEAGIHWAPSWSPNGQKLVFSRAGKDQANINNQEIYTLGGTGGEVTKLTDDPGTDMAPVWSPDGSQIAFASDREGNFEIFMMDADGSRLVNLSNSPGYDNIPAWSPDGNKIVYTSERDGNWAIAAVDIHSGLVTSLTADFDFDWGAMWSPDSRRLAFVRSSSLLPDGDVEIYVMDSDGSSPLNLSQDSATDDLPNWSPDGTQVVFRSNRNGRKELYLANPDGSGVRRLTQSTEDVGDFAISPK